MKPRQASGCLQKPRLPGCTPQGTWETEIREAFQRWFWQPDGGGEKREHQGSLNSARLTENKRERQDVRMCPLAPSTTELGVYAGPSLNNLGGAPKLTHMHTLCPLAGQSLPGLRLLKSKGLFGLAEYFLNLF